MTAKIFKKKFDIVSSYKFSDTATDEKPTLWLGNASIDEWLLTQYTSVGSCNQNLLHYGYHKTCGWVFHFNLNRYIYKYYGSWHEAYAPNKQLLRKCIHGHISEIVKIS